MQVPCIARADQLPSPHGHCCPDTPKPQAMLNALCTGCPSTYWSVVSVGMHQIRSGVVVCITTLEGRGMVTGDCLEARRSGALKPSRDVRVFVRAR
jgi:hypothetical protein